MSNKVSPGEQLESLSPEQLVQAAHNLHVRIEHYKHYTVGTLISEIKHYHEEVERAQTNLAIMQYVLRLKAKGEM